MEIACVAKIVFLDLHRNKSVYAEIENILHIGTHTKLSITSIFFKPLVLTWSNHFLVVKKQTNKYANMLYYSFFGG